VQEDEIVDMLSKKSEMFISEYRRMYFENHTKIDASEREAKEVSTTVDNDCAHRQQLRKQRDLLRRPAAEVLPALPPQAKSIVCRRLCAHCAHICRLPSLTVRAILKKSW
jgi:hypothetical protein